MQAKRMTTSWLPWLLLALHAAAWASSLTDTELIVACKEGNRRRVTDILRERPSAALYVSPKVTPFRVPMCVCVCVSPSLRRSCSEPLARSVVC
jgi:hypothetical protein